MDSRRDTPNRASDVFGRSVHGQKEDDRFCTRVPKVRDTKVMHRYIVMAAAWLEIVVGVIFIAVPDVPCLLLFGARPEGMGVPLAHWSGLVSSRWALPVYPRRPQDHTVVLCWGFLSLTLG